MSLRFSKLFERAVDALERLANAQEEANRIADQVNEPDAKRPPPEPWVELEKARKEKRK